MCFKIAVLTFVCIGGLAAQRVQEKRQIGSPVLLKEDNVPAETGFTSPAAAAHAGSKYFQYIHVPAKDHYEHGHKRGNEHHFIERHEKGHPHAGEFKNKVRWGDKHGGYGEHYWDYNHDGHGHDGHGEESQHNSEYATYEDESKNVPVLTTLEKKQRGKRGGQELLKDVEFISDKARSLIVDGTARKHGGNYRKANDFRGKREEQKDFGESLIYDPALGLDQHTGIQYQLSPLK